VRLIDCIQPLRIVPRLWMRNIEESDNRTPACLDVLVTVPFLVVSVVLAFVVRLLNRFLVGRVLNAFVKNLFGVLWSVRTFRARNGVAKAEVVQKGREGIRVILEFELFVEKVLYLLFFQGWPSQRRSMNCSCSASSSFGSLLSPKFGVSLPSPP